MSKIVKISVIVLSIAAALTAFFLVRNSNLQNSIPTIATIAKSSHSSGSNVSAKNVSPSSKAVVKPQPVKLHMIAVGDDIMHDGLYNAAKTATSYDFTPFYVHVKGLVKQADVAFVNQETMMAGAKYRYTSYPCFNTPQQLMQNLIDTGFNVFNMSNNHAMDKGEQAAIDYMHFIKSFSNITHVGMYETEKESEQPAIFEKNGVKIAFLAYTYGTNGIPLPKDMPFLVEYIDKDRITADVLRAKQQADCVIVSMHWGIEYQHTINDQQKDIAKLLASLNVDVVLGMHPHVVEPVEWLSGANGHKTLVFYSLGNFISYQTVPDCLLGAMASYDIIKSTDNAISIENVKITPLVTHYDSSKNIGIYPLSEYTDALAAKHSANIKGNHFDVKYFKDLSKRIFGDFYTP
jgi:poly-gamma-glutamate capsule biosynthesis protein CapA/YwtB (metallophosphatase superfamily)